MERNETNWLPSAEQVKLAELLLNPEDRRSKREKFAEAGVPVTTAYRWFKDENYLAYINERLDELTNSELADVWKALILQCKRGNVNAIKLFFEMKNMYVDRKEVKIPEGIPIKGLTGLTTDELRAIAYGEETEQHTT